MNKMIALATVAAFSACVATSASAQSTGPAGQDTTTKGADTMSKDGMKNGSMSSGTTGGAMAPTAPRTNDASKSGAPSASSAEKGMTSGGSSTMSK